MNEELMNKISKAVAKEKLKIKWYEKGEDLIAHYQGFNKKYAEKIDFKLVVGPKGYSIEVVPLISFDYLEHFPTFEEYQVEKIEGKCARFSVKGDSINPDEIIEKIEFIFSVDVLMIYKIMLTQEYQFHFT